MTRKTQSSSATQAAPTDTFKRVSAPKIMPSRTLGLDHESLELIYQHFIEQDATQTPMSERMQLALDRILESEPGDLDDDLYQELMNAALWLKVRSASRAFDVAQAHELLNFFENRDVAGLSVPSFQDLAPMKGFEQLDPYARQGLTIGKDWPLSWVAPQDQKAFMEHLLQSEHLLLDQALQVPPRQIQQRLLNRAPFPPDRQAAFNELYAVISSRAEGNDPDDAVQRASRNSKRQMDMSLARYRTDVSTIWSDATFS